MICIRNTNTRTLTDKYVTLMYYFYVFETWIAINRDTVLTLPMHSSHVMQLLDLLKFGPVMCHTKQALMHRRCLEIQAQVTQKTGECVDKVLTKSALFQCVIWYKVRRQQILL